MTIGGSTIKKQFNYEDVCWCTGRNIYYYFYS